MNSPEAEPDLFAIFTTPLLCLRQSEKHLKDIRKILLFQKDSLDWPWLEATAGSRGLAPFLDTARSG